MKKFLKYINSIPFPISIKHYQTFGDSNSLLENSELNSALSWDILRERHPQFSISKNREEWLKASNAQVKKDGQDGGVINRAKDIDQFLIEKGINSVFSVGVGGAGLEYQMIKNNPNLVVFCSEYSKVNVELLKAVFTEAQEIIRFDILKGDWNEIREKYLTKDSILLMYRVDASFSDVEWFDVFKKLREAKIEKILFIPSSNLTLISIFNRKFREIKWLLRKTEIVFSGYLRTKKMFESYWSGMYSSRMHEFGGLKGFYLELK